MSCLNTQKLSYPQAGPWSFRPNSTSEVPPGKSFFYTVIILAVSQTSPIAVTPEDNLNPL